MSRSLLRRGIYETFKALRNHSFLETSSMTRPLSFRRYRKIGPKGRKGLQLLAHAQTSYRKMGMGAYRGPFNPTRMASRVANRRIFKRGLKTIQRKYGKTHKRFSPVWRKRGGFKF